MKTEGRIQNPEDRIRRAVVIGGTRGIGRATGELLRVQGWEVTAFGSREWDIHSAYRLPLPACDALIWCAASIKDEWANAFHSPMWFYRACLDEIVNDGGVIVAVSSVAAERPAKVNPHYAAAKAALESYARTVADSEVAKAHGWRVEVVRFDLVRTEMMSQLPLATLAGRRVITVEEAAGEIWELVVEVAGGAKPD